MSDVVPRRPPMVPSRVVQAKAPQVPQASGVKRRQSEADTAQDNQSGGGGGGEDVNAIPDPTTNDDGSGETFAAEDAPMTEAVEVEPQPMEQPIQRRAPPPPSKPPVNRAAIATAAKAGYAGYRPGAGKVLPPPPEPEPEDQFQIPTQLPDDPAEAKKVLDRIESQRKTAILKKKCQPAAPSVVKVNERKCPPSVWLSKLNPNLCDLDIKANKSKDPKQAMYYVTHLYQGKTGPSVQVQGRLLSTPMVSATYDTTNLTIELTDVVEQRNWSGMSRQFKKNFVQKAVEKKWPFAGTMVNKMVFRDFYFRGKIIDPALREKYADPDSLPENMIDPETKQPIECYPPRIKANLVMSKKNRNDLETDVMDEDDVQMNPYDLRRGNLVRMVIRMGYAYYKAQIGSQMPNEYGVPCKLAMIKRLDKHEETDSGPLKRTRWAEDEESPVVAPPPPNPNPTPNSTPNSGANPGANAHPPLGPPPPPNPPQVEAMVDAAMLEKIKQQAQMTAPKPTTTTTPPTTTTTVAPAASPAAPPQKASIVTTAPAKQ